MRWLVLLALLLPIQASAQVFAPFKFSVASAGASCTDGVDCLCDTITTSSTLVRCEDFEQPGLYIDTTDDWAVGSGSPHNRGVGSRWSLRFGNGPSPIGSQDFTGAAYIGTACEILRGSPGPPFGCSGMPEWCSSDQGALTAHGASDCWGPGINATSVIDIQRSGDFDAEVTDLTLTGGTGETADVGGGRAHLAMRNGPGEPGQILGGVYLHPGNNGDINNNTNYTEVGITMKLAYSPNIFTEADTVLDGMWKHDEWGGPADSGPGGASRALEFWNLGNTGCGGADEFPYNGFLFHAGAFPSEDATACNAALSAASKTVGNADCTGVALRLCSTTAYSQPTDFPGGTWACHQAHIKGMGTSDVDIEIKHNGVTVIKLENFDGAALDNPYYDSFLFNNFANTNDPASGGSIETDETMYRYQDDIVVVNGPPEPCSAIGM